MKKFRNTLLIFIFIIPFTFNGFSQFNLMPNRPLSSFNLNDLWNLSVFMNGTNSFDHFLLTLEIYDNSQGLIVTSTSSSFNLNPGTLVITNNNTSILEPFNTNYSSNDPAFNGLIANGGYFPSGNYNISFKLLGVTVDPGVGSITEQLATSTYSQQVLSIYPPALIYLYNTDTTYSLTPVFSWLPPFPIPNNQTVQYQIKFVEILTGQAAYDAMSINPDFYLESNIYSTFFNYPLIATQFINNQSYAWKISAFSNGINIGESDVWEFRYVNMPPNPDPTIVENLNTYAELKTELDGKYFYITDNYLKFTFNQKYFLPEGSKLVYKIYNNKNKEVASSGRSIDLDVHQGINNFTVSTCADGLNLGVGFYTLIVSDEKSGKLYLRFNNSKTVPCQ
jgi:hypothetical protein